MKHLQEYINNSTVNSRIELEARIAELERQLVERREELANTEQRHQKQLTVVGALATAIKQTLSAVKLAVEAGEPGLVDSFWAEMQDIQDGNYDEKELLSLPTSEDNDDSNNNPNPVNEGPHTHDSLVKLNLNGVKEVASGLDISVKDVKQYGSTRQKLSWITAILEKQKAETKPETNGKVDNIKSELNRKVENVKPETNIKSELNGNQNVKPETNEKVETVKPLVTSPPVETNDVVDVDSTVVDNSTVEDENDYEGW